VEGKPGLQSTGKSVVCLFPSLRKGRCADAPPFKLLRIPDQSGHTPKSIQLCHCYGASYLSKKLGAVQDFQAPGMPEHPGTPPAPISVSGTAGPAACGETKMAVRSAIAIRSGPTVATGPRRAREICFFSGA